MIIYRYMYLSICLSFVTFLVTAFAQINSIADPHSLLSFQTIAKNMGLDTSNYRNLWKDQALVEVNLAVLHSYQVSHSHYQSQSVTVTPPVTCNCWHSHSCTVAV